jgi:pyrroloquinoline quinone biosynthesis protein D
MPLTTASVPALWRLARLSFDPVRQQSVLLYPEGAILLNASGAAILELCVTEYLAELIEREFVHVE